MSYSGGGEPRPNSLGGYSVVVTRPRLQAVELIRGIEQLGGEVVHLPLIEIVDPSNGGAALNSALSRMDAFDWVVFTSTNAVERVGRSLEGFEGAVAAVGSGTSEALESIGIAVELVPPSYVAESLVEAFPHGPGRVLLPQAAGARKVVAEGLRSKGWSVEAIEAYSTRRTEPSRELLRSACAADLITFASSSAVSGFVDLIDPEVPVPPVACIGPVTATTATEAGLDVVVVASEHNVDGLVRAIVKYATDEHP